MLTLKPLSHEKLTMANKLRNSVFQYLSKEEKLTLDASLDPSMYVEVYQALSITSLTYWIAELDDVMVGLVGLYEEKDDALDTYWLGWYCVDPAYRGQNIGKKLIAFAIHEAKMNAKRYLKLYTTVHDAYGVARMQYEKIGFTCSSKKGKTLHYCLDLESI